MMRALFLAAPRMPLKAAARAGIAQLRQKAIVKDNRPAEAGI
jgi:hypothetical protein